MRMRQIYLLLIITLFFEANLSAQDPEALREDISVAKIQDVQSDAIRIDYDPISGNIYFARVGGGIYRVNLLTKTCLLYTSPSPRDNRVSRMPSSA